MYKVFLSDSFILPKKVNWNMSEQMNNNVPNTNVSNNSGGQDPSSQNTNSKEVANAVKKTAVIFTLVSILVNMLCSGFFGKIGENIHDKSSDILNAPEQIVGLNQGIESLSEEVAALKEMNIAMQFASINEDIEDTNDKIDEVKDDLSEDIKCITNKIDNFLFAGAYMRLFPSQDISFAHETVTNEYKLAQPTWTTMDVVAVDPVSDKEYVAKDLANITLLLPYTENGQEVYFYGQFNDNNHWDDNCIINVYENNELVLIMDAVYDDGKLVEYKQVLPYTTGKGKAAWIVSDRKALDGYNSGNSWSYLRTKSYTKNFTPDTVVAGNIMSVESFTESLDEILEGFYHGNTLNGLYNDSTGNAYQVKYFEDGTVSMVYQGMFKDGQFEDSTGNAWYICKEIDTEYMYYKGTFSSGKPLNDSDSTFENPISLERIKEIIKGKEFECEIKWYENM